MSESVEYLDKAIAELGFEPKGIKVGNDLWKELKMAGRIEWKKGVLKFKDDPEIDSETEFPMINGCVFVHVAPELDSYSYELPKKP